MHGKRSVGHERPWRRGPHHDAPALHPTIARMREIQREIHRRIFHVLIALGDFMTRKRGAAARAIRQDLVPLEQQLFLIQRGERPPHRLHVLVGVRDVGILIVEPVADPAADRLPLLPVGPDALAAARVERLDTEPLDVLLATDAQRLLDLDLHGQPVRVPPRFPAHRVAGHRAMAAEQVLERSREHMMDPGTAIGRRRSFQEHPARLVRVLRERLFEQALVAPPREKGLLHLSGRLFRRENGVVRLLVGHAGSFSSTPVTSVVSTGSAFAATAMICSSVAGTSASGKH